MSSTPRLGALFKPGTPLCRLPDWARRVEQLGFDEAWVAEDAFRYGGIAAPATVLALTDQVQVGIGLLPVMGRNPVIAAMEIASLAQLHPCRLQVAMGHGVESWMRRIGARPRDRMVALEEVVSVITRLLRGERVTMQGCFVQIQEAELIEPPAVMPRLMIGTTGERGLALAASDTDGLVLPEGSGESAIQAAARSLNGQGELVVYAWLRIDEDAERAFETVRPALEAWRRKGLYRNLLSRWEIEPEKPLDAAAARRVALVGSAQDCASTLSRLARAGATTVVVMPVGEEPSGQLECFAEEVRPLVLAESFT
jgi:5,10-methylenetetrahydromethanopterin reductase